MSNTNEFTPEKAIKQLQSYKVVSEGTTKNVRIAWVNEKPQENGRYIVNLEAIGTDGLAKAKELAMQGRFQEATWFRLNFSVREEDKHKFATGEIVDIQVAKVKIVDESSREKYGADEKLSVSVALKQQAKEASTDDFFAQFSNVAQEAPVQEDFATE